MFSKLKSWWIELLYGSKEDQERKAWLDKEHPGWDEEAMKEREAAEDCAPPTCTMCGKDAKEYLLIEDRQGDFYCRSCFNIMYDPDIRYQEGVGFFKRLK